MLKVPSADAVVAIDKTGEVDGVASFCFDTPRWSFITRFVPPSHPALLDIAFFAGAYRLAFHELKPGETPSVATALIESRFSLSRAILRSPPLALARMAASWTDVESPTPTMTATLAAPDGTVWCRYLGRSKALGSLASFAERRTASKARLEPSTPLPKAPAALVGWEKHPSLVIIGPLEDGGRVSRFAASKEWTLEQHPFLNGSGDHFNSQHIRCALLEFAHLVIAARTGRPCSCVLVAEKIKFIRFVEFGPEMRLVLKSLNAVPAGQKSFTDVEHGSVPSDWAGDPLFNVVAELHQAGRLCSELDSTVCVTSMLDASKL